MMEVMYSNGARRAELANLELFDIDAERHVLAIRVGKGRKDRMVPIGERALHWVGRYVEEVRPELVVSPDAGVLFLDEETGERMRLPRLTQLMKRYVDAAQLGKSGACHIFRHAMATHMLEGGCDVRLLQEILGHAELSTTAIYTRISIKHLVRVHEQTHPTSKLDCGKATTVTEDAAAADALLAALDTEGDEEDDVAAKDNGS